MQKRQSTGLYNDTWSLKSITSVFNCEDILFKCHTSHTIAAEHHQKGRLKQKVTYVSCRCKIQDRCETTGLEVVYIYLYAFRVSTIMHQLLELSEPILKPAA